ncbi:MAG TPA: putative quinol monooxygenase [Chitinophaga sp.]
MLYVTAIMHAKRDTEMIEQLKDLLRTLVTETRKEPGCVQYDLFQAESDNAVFIMHEKWASEEAFKGHSSQLHFTLFATAAAPFFAEQIVIYRMQALV